MKIKKTNFALSMLAALAVSVCPLPAQAAPPPFLTYQGQIETSGSAVNGQKSVELFLCSSPVGAPAGTTPNPAPSGCYDTGTQQVSVVNGLFYSTFTAPSGVDLTQGTWYLQVLVGAAGAPSFTAGLIALGPLEALTSSPYALVSSSAVFASSATTLISAFGQTAVSILSNVGIGTAAPPQYVSLDVYTGVSGNFDNLSIESPSSSNGFGLKLDNHSQGWGVGMNIGNYSDGRFQIVDLTHGSYVATILATGDVGIGTQSPDANFAVNGNVSFDNGYIQSNGSGDLSVYSVTGSTFVVMGSGSGNVGIGTSSPQATLDIEGFARLKPQSGPPTTCGANNVGAIAMAMDYNICVCNGGNWIEETQNGAADEALPGQACVWQPAL
jgi:hypothetical protein